MEYKRIKPTDYEHPIGDIYSLWVFLDYVWSGCIIPSDGSIGCIIIDGTDTDLFDEEWMMNWGGNHNHTNMAELVEYAFMYGFRDKQIQIRWCNK